MRRGANSGAAGVAAVGVEVAVPQGAGIPNQGPVQDVGLGAYPPVCRRNLGQQGAAGRWCMLICPTFFLFLTPGFVL